MTLNMADRRMNQAEPLPKEFKRINGDIASLIALADSYIYGCTPQSSYVIETVERLTDAIRMRNGMLNAVYERATVHSRQDIDSFIQEHLSSSEEDTNDIMSFLGLRNKLEDSLLKHNGKEGALAGAFARTEKSYVHLNEAIYSMLETAQRHSEGVKPRQLSRSLDTFLEYLN